MTIFWSLPCILEILEKRFHTRASFGVVDYDIGKKAIFVRFRRFFIVGTKATVFGIQTSCLRINRRFRADIFERAIFGDFSSLRQNCRLATKVAVYRTLPAVWGIKCRFRDDFLLGQFSASFSSFYGHFFKF